MMPHLTLIALNQMLSTINQAVILMTTMPSDRDVHLDLFTEQESSQLEINQEEHYFHGTRQQCLLELKMAIKGLGQTAKLLQRCSNKRYVSSKAVIGSKQVELPEAKECIGTVITKLVRGQLGAKAGSIKKWLPHFAPALK